MASEPTTARAEAPPPRWGNTRLLAGAALLALLVAGALAAGTLPRLKRELAVREQTAESAARPPRVAVATARRVSPDAERVLPGNCLAMTVIAVYPRTTGFLKWWKADIGDQVKAGQ